MNEKDRLREASGSCPGATHGRMRHREHMFASVPDGTAAG
jgi:hypothetical protein